MGDLLGRGVRSLLQERRARPRGDARPGGDEAVGSVGAGMRGRRLGGGRSGQGSRRGSASSAGGRVR